MDKRGISEYMVQWIPRMLFLALVIVVVMSLLRNTVVQYEDTSKARAYVYMNKILYDKDGIIRYENDRSFPGVVDFEKFKSANLDKILVVGSKLESPAAMLNLRSAGTGEIIKTIYWNEQWFGRLEPKGIFRGPGAPASIKDSIYVNLYRDNKLEPAVLDMHILVPK